VATRENLVQTAADLECERNRGEKQEGREEVKGKERKDKEKKELIQTNPQRAAS